MELIRHLATMPLFEGLPPKQYAAPAAISVRFLYEKGQKIFSEGNEVAVFTGHGFPAEAAAITEEERNIFNHRNERRFK